MIRPSSSCIALVLTCICLFFAQQARGQALTGFSYVDYNESTGRVYAYSETTAEYPVQEYYQAQVVATLTDGNGTVLNSMTVRDTIGNGYASVTFSRTVSPSTQYTMTGKHSAIATLSDYDMTAARYFYDYFNFSNFAFLNINETPRYYFRGLGPLQRPRQSVLYLGKTYDTDVAGPKVMISGPQSVKDGASFGTDFNVTTEGGTPTSYSWSFVAPPGAGNNPNVNFSPSNAASTRTDAHWFAYPNDPCSAAADAVYTIKCTVTFSGGVTKTAQTTLTVNAYWYPGGSTAPPIIRGGPEIERNPVSGLYVLVGPGTFARETQSPIIYVPYTSQFYNKTTTHENEHVRQWQTGMWSDLYHINNLMTYLYTLNLQDTTVAGLISQITQARDDWVNGEFAAYTIRLAAGEREAYATSDLHPPQYLYQNCGRY